MEDSLLFGLFLSPKHYSERQSCSKFSKSVEPNRESLNLQYHFHASHVMGKVRNSQKKTDNYFFDWRD